MAKKTYYIIDFDSTFIQVEALDELAKRTLKNNPQREEIQKEIEDITKQGMEGKIDFGESLAQRLFLFKPTRNDIAELVQYLKRKITPSIKKNKTFFTENFDSIYIISGGFREYIEPIVTAFGIPSNHILANEFQFNSKGTVIGFNDKIVLSKAKGKAKIVNKLKLKGKIIVLGDGMTDYEIKKEQAADIFYAFTENISREPVVAVADDVIPNFDELLFRNKVQASVSYPKNRIKVLLLEKIDKLAVEAFKKEGYDVETVKSALDEDELCERIRDVSILGIRSKTKITQKVLKYANRLLAVGAYCIGTNQIDLKACSEKGIIVFNAPFSNTRSVVELVLGEIMVLMRKVFEKSTKMHAGIWDKNAAGCHEIRGKKLGIIGYGNIGSQLSVLAEALGMDVYFYDIDEKLALGNAKKCLSMKELLKKCDIVSIHVYSSPKNINLIGEKEFALMKNDTVFINAARGEVVNEKALVKYLKNGKLAGAALDVFPKEPKSAGDTFNSDLQNLQNVILTPHIGGSTEEAQRDIASFVSKRITLFINQGDTTLSVNFPNLQLPAIKDYSRIIHIHHNTPGILARINNIIAKEKINIEAQYLKTNEQIGYVIIDLNTNHAKRLTTRLKDVSDTIKVRVLY
jgi:D-3-phosphoglycerate dehydrogenase